MNDITRDHFLDLDLHFDAVPGDDGLEGQGFFETGHDVASVVLLDEANNCIEQQQAADHTKVNPVLKTGGEDS